MPEEPISKREILGLVAGGVITLLSYWLELALGVVMIFGSVIIAVACWYWLGDRGWWASVPLIALNLAWTGACIWLVRNPDALLSKPHHAEYSNHEIPMIATILTRHGHSESITSPDSDWITHKLLAELRAEQFDEPDDEHTQVSVSNEHWSVSAQVSGLVFFDNLDLLEGEESDLPETMYLRDIEDAELISLWQAVALGDKAALLSHPWAPDLESLPPYQSDYYRTA